jgi:hypothetical protein
MVDIDAIRQEAAQLHGFIEPLIQMCSDLREDYPIFAGPSLKFFSYISKLGTKTQEFLEAFPTSYAGCTDQRAANSMLLGLSSLKASWETLHNYVGPALDADSLNLPSSLITAFSDIANSVPEWADYEFVLFHTSEANYLQIPSGMARDAADNIADKVGLELFDPNLGLVGIPYSQANSFFLNSLLPHEFAHFIYQEYCDDAVESQIDRVLDDKTANSTDLTSDGLAWCLGQLRSWIEETFCDLLAACMIGPAFSFALIQLTAGTALVGRPDGVPSDLYAFRDDYPADAARLHYHQKLLQRVGWWSVIEGWKSSHVGALAKCEIWSSLITIEGQLPEGISEADLLDCYRAVCDWMIDYCVAFFPSIDADVQQYRQLSPKIAEYLSRAIVPSTINLDAQQFFPTPVVLLNSGFHFLLEDLPSLVKNIDGLDVESVAVRSRIGARLELWILKAIEDYRLLTRQVD